MTPDKPRPREFANPIEEFQYLIGLKDLSWNDCQDAWFRTVKLMPEIAAAYDQLQAEVEHWKRLEGEKHQESINHMVARNKAESEVGKLTKERDEYKRLAESWMADYDKMVAKYQPLVAVTSSERDALLTRAQGLVDALEYSACDQYVEVGVRCRPGNFRICSRCAALADWNKWREGGGE